MYKIAIAGLRHSHINELINKSIRHSELELVGIAESDDAARASAEQAGREVVWTDPYKMIAELDFDILGIGDAYGKRGALAIAALKAGKHVIADKPLCTTLEELSEIRQLAAEKNLSVGMMLSMWSDPNPTAAKQLIDAGKVGEIQSIVFTAQHPLNYGTRPDWYWNSQLHGGTINDIAPHAVDMVKFLTGCNFAKIHSARVWNSNFPEVPTFQNGAQFMAQLENGAGVMGDVSYFSSGFGLPFYWRFGIWGTNGYLEFNIADPGVTLVEKGVPGVRKVYPGKADTNYLDEFLKEIKGGTPEFFNTAHVLDLSEFALKLQAEADRTFQMGVYA